MIMRGRGGVNRVARSESAQIIRDRECSEHRGGGEGGGELRAERGAGKGLYRRRGRRRLSL